MSCRRNKLKPGCYNLKANFGTIKTLVNKTLGVVVKRGKSSIQSRTLFSDRIFAAGECDAKGWELHIGPIRIETIDDHSNDGENDFSLRVRRDS